MASFITIRYRLSECTSHRSNIPQITKRTKRDWRKFRQILVETIMAIIDRTPLQPHQHVYQDLVEMPFSVG